MVTAHPGIFTASALLLLVKSGFLGLCISAYFFLFASQVSVTTNPTTHYCEFTMAELSTSDKAMYAAVTVFAYWSLELWKCVRFFVVSLTTGVWYYQNESLAAQEV